MNDYENRTKIPWNDYNRDKIIKLGRSLMGTNIGDPANHGMVQAAIRSTFPQFWRHQDIYAVYVALASDLTKVNRWEDVLEQFMPNDTFAIWEDDGENERLSCICAQTGLGSTFGLQNLITGVVLNVGSTCVYKNSITEAQKEKHKEMTKKVKAERKRRQQERENFRCCKKCKEYVIPKQGVQNTTCFNCRTYKPGFKRCSRCKLCKIKENTSYTKCFECYKLKK